MDVFFCMYCKRYLSFRVLLVGCGGVWKESGDAQFCNESESKGEAIRVTVWELVCGSNAENVWGSSQE